MISNFKILLLEISIFPFIFCFCEPTNTYYELEKPENFEYNVNYFYNENFSFLSLANNGSDLSFVEGVIKYIFTEQGNEINIQTKYLNKGNWDKCTLQYNLPKYYIITKTKIEGGNNLNYQTNTDNIVEFNFILESNNYAIISFKIINKNINSKFYRVYSPYISKNIKYTFRAKQPLEIIGIEYGRLKQARQKNGALYYYHKDTKEYDFIEKIYISSYGIQFKSDLSTVIDLYFWQKFSYLTVPNLHEFGNNEIISNQVLSNLNENELKIEKDKRFITVKADKRGVKLSFTFNKEFQSKLDNKWVLDGADLVNTCTTKAKNKVSEIL